MLKLKKSVSLVKIQPQLLLAMIAVRDIYDSLKRDCIITSICDGTHSENSLHYVGLAFDVRIKNIPTKSEIDSIVNQIRASLTPDFDIVLEPDHIHIEYDPKTIES